MFGSTPDLFLELNHFSKIQTGNINTNRIKFRSQATLFTFLNLTLDSLQNCAFKFCTRQRNNKKKHIWW